MPKQTPIERITLEEVEYICIRLLDELYPGSKPYSIFITRFTGVLESVIAQPFQQIYE